MVVKKWESSQQGHKFSYTNIRSHLGSSTCSKKVHVGEVHVTLTMNTEGASLSSTPGVESTSFPGPTQTWGAISPTEWFAPIPESIENSSVQSMRSNWAQGSTLQQFMELFVSATPGGMEGVMRKPGSAGLSVLLQTGGIQTDMEHIQRALSILGWGEDHDYTYKDFRELGVTLGCVESDQGNTKKQCVKKRKKTRK